MNLLHFWNVLSDTVLKPILSIKKEALVSYYKTLQLQEVLIALSICAVTNPVIKKALNNLSKLKGSNAHCTYILTDSDAKVLKNLKINLTCEPQVYNDAIGS